MTRFRALEEQVDSLEPLVLSGGVIPVFGEYTEELSRSLYACFCRYDKRNSTDISGTYKHKRDLIKIFVEHYAILGGIMAKRVYDMGCGIALPSLAYALLTGERVTGVDILESELEEASRLANLLNVDDKVELIKRQAEGVNVRDRDTVLFSEPEAGLTRYWKSLIEDYAVTLVLSDVFNLRDYLGRKVHYDLENRRIRSSVEKTFPDGYDVDVSRARVSDQRLVFVGER